MAIHIVGSIRGLGSCSAASLFTLSGYTLADGVAICLVLSISRVVFFQLLVFLAKKFASQESYFAKEEDTAESSSDKNIREKLLKHVAETNDTEDTERKQARYKSRVSRFILLTLIFVLSSSYQVYYGVKVTKFQFKNYFTIETIILCLNVLWVNIQAYFYRSLVTDLASEEGLYLKDVHRHPLFWVRGIILHICDLCKEKIENKVGGCYRCKMCDFDCCVKCAQRTDIVNVGEDLVRSDKGVKLASDVSGSSYFKRAISIATPQQFNVIIALMLLTLNCFTNLALPHFQGVIINDLISNNTNSFMHHIKVYLFVLLMQGFFQGISTFLFSYVFRKLTFFVRNKLFAAVLYQDIAFFDGTTSGNLTSKLTNDIIWYDFTLFLVL